MTLAEDIQRVGDLRAWLEAHRDIAPPEEWAELDAKVRALETDLERLVALARAAVQRWERPDLWAMLDARSLDDGR